MKPARLIVAFMLALCAPAFAAAPPPQPTVNDVRSLLVGTWQSEDDSRFSREFDADGTSVDRYDGDASATTNGRWTVFTGQNAPAALSGYKFVPDGFYLAVKEENGDFLLFQLTAANLASLEMIYMERGNTLRFSRLK